MSARHEIEALIFAYAERIDAGDFEGVGALFADAVVTMEGAPEPRRGSREVCEMFRSTTRIYEETGTPRTKHVTTNVRIELDEASGRAETRSYFTVLQQTPTLPLQTIIAGRYHDKFERSAQGDGRWRFASRHITCDLFGDLSQHLLFDAQQISGNRPD